jgi:hypothetical protein
MTKTTFLFYFGFIFSKKASFVIHKIRSFSQILTSKSLAEQSYFGLRSDYAHLALTVFTHAHYLTQIHITFSIFIDNDFIDW